MKLVGDRLRKCIACSGTNTDTLVLQVLNEKNYVTILVNGAQICLTHLFFIIKKIVLIFQPTISVRAMMQKYSSKRNQCELAIAKEELNWKPAYFGLPKSSPYADEIRKA